MSLKIVKFKQYLLFFSDLGILYASLVFTLFARYQKVAFSDFESHVIPFSIIYLLWVVVFYINGLYDLAVNSNSSVFWKKFGSSMAVNTLIAVAVFYLTPGLGIAPKTNLFINLAVFSLFFVCWRSVFNKISATGILKNRVLIIGEGEEIEEIKKNIQEKPQLGYKLITHLKISNNQSAFSYLHNLISEKKIDTILMPINSKESEEITGHLYQYIFDQINFIDSSLFYENLTGKIPVALTTKHWFLENLRENDKKSYDSAKIIFDYLLAGLFGIITLFVFPFAAAAIKIQDNGPVFYRQKRVGKFGKIFEIVKFRTMRTDAEKDGAQFAVTNDSRITKIGKFLRETRIDELPQIINVLRGEMSFLGPRPEQPEFVDKLQNKMAFYNLRHLVKPGLTGWAQVNYQYAGTLEENLKKLQYDLFYIKNRSAFLDFLIILRTFNIFLKRKGL
jgi:exopolysaccharide biosynthesis polyprenyl glycosylphosphotransferase